MTWSTSHPTFNRNARQCLIAAHGAMLLAFPYFLNCYEVGRNSDEPTIQSIQASRCFAPIRFDGNYLRYRLWIKYAC